MKNFLIIFVLLLIVLTGCSDQLSTEGTVTTIAGSAGVAGYADGNGTSAEFNKPWGIVSDGTSLYVAEYEGCYVRKINISSSEVTTLAGSGTMTHADGTGTSASLYGPTGLCIVDGNLYVADSQSGRIRKIVISSAEVTTLATGLGFPQGIASDGTNLYVVENTNNKISKIVISTGAVSDFAGSGTAGDADGTGTSATLNMPIDIACDGTNLYVTDEQNFSIRKIVIASGVVSTLVEELSSPRGIATDGSYLFYSDSNAIRRMDLATEEVVTVAGVVYSEGSDDGAGGSARFKYPQALFLQDEVLFVSDTQNHTIRKIEF